jgi:hypothetical protein
VGRDVFEDRLRKRRIETASPSAGAAMEEPRCGSRSLAVPMGVGGDVAED